jgi:RNA polymerase sigma factor for flagellar operon FliA
LRLVDNDYAILRAYERLSSFATFISVVVQRMALDYRNHMWGRWHASAEAKRLGGLAVDLEQILRRDGRTIEEAVVLLRSKHDGVTPESLATLAARLPPRGPRHRDVPLEEATIIELQQPADVEEPILANERRQVSARVSEVMSNVIARLPDEDRLILQLRFEGGMTVAQIARALRLDQKLTYRRVERNMRDIRRDLEQAGIAARDIADLIGRDETFLKFPLGKSETRPSIRSDETTQAYPEESP